MKITGKPRPEAMIHLLNNALKPGASTALKRLASQFAYAYFRLPVKNEWTAIFADDEPWNRKFAEWMLVT